MILDIRHWTLRAKVIFHVLVLGAASAGILTLLSMTTHRGVIYALIQREADLVGSLTKSSVFFLKKCGRVEDAQAEIHELALTTRGIKSIRILTPAGRIFASTRAEEKSTELSPEDRGTIRAMVAERAARQTRFSRSERTIRSLLLVENEPECYSCHGSERRVNGVLEVVFDYREASDLIWKSQWKGIVPAVLSLGILTFIILRLFERLINRPISLLKDKMKKVQDGDLSVRLEPRKNDEIGSLTVSFNLMVEKLKAANREIEALYNQRIERAEHLAAFGELAAGLAHEVKNPLSGMKGALEIISQNTTIADPQKEIFQEILVQIDKIICVMQDFLSYARPKPPHFSPVVPGLFVENAVRLAKTQLNGKDIRFHFHPSGQDPPHLSGRGPPAGSDPEPPPQQHLGHRQTREHLYFLKVRAEPGPVHLHRRRRPRDQGIAAASYLQSVLLDQEGRDRAGAFDLQEDHRRPQGDDLRPQPGGEGDDLHPPSAARPAV